MTCATHSTGVCIVKAIRMRIWLTQSSVLSIPDKSSPYAYNLWLTWAEPELAEEGYQVAVTVEDVMNIKGFCFKRRF